MQKATNLPAFPLTEYSDHNERRGITIRDYFAAAALQAFSEVATETDFGGSSHTGRANWWWSGGDIAKRCYEIADAMLKARGEEV